MKTYKIFVSYKTEEFGEKKIFKDTQTNYADTLYTLHFLPEDWIIEVIKIKVID